MISSGPIRRKPSEQRWPAATACSFCRQVDACLDLGIDARIWNSDTSEEVKKQVLSELVSDEPEMRLLYTTPESLRNPTFRGYLKESHEAGKLLSFAVDEAHCVSDWGHDFRPAYLELTSLKADFPITPIAALTASCTSVVEGNITNLLGMKDPLIIKGGFNRPNIEYRVVYKELIGDGKQDDVVEHLVHFIKERAGQGGIIYARLRSTCDWLCSTLGNFDLDVGCYHAGKDAQRRRKVQQDWGSGGLDIVVATVAFGMGIDRADVRWVVHWDAPSSLEGFYQESGRAGRDGLPSESVLYVGADDLDTITKLEKHNRAGAAAAVAGWCAQPGCKRKKVVEYFGQRRGPCDAGQGELLCDYCSQPQATRRLIQDWEQHVSRRDVQLTLQKQRQAADDTEAGVVHGMVAAAAACSEEQQQALSAGGARQQQQQQQETRQKKGVWGLARLHSSAGTTAASACAETRHARAAAAAGGAGSDMLQLAAAGGSSVLRPLQNTLQPLLPQASDAQAAAGTTTTGVCVARPAAPAAIPQLLRKRLAAMGSVGTAFKAPRMSAAVSSCISSKQGESSGSDASASHELQLKAPADAHHGSSTACSRQVTGGGYAVAASTDAPCHPDWGSSTTTTCMMPRVPHLSRAAVGRAAFVPPLKPKRAQ